MSGAPTLPRAQPTAARYAHAMPFGATVQDDNRVRFALWAPSAERVTLQLSPGARASEAIATERDADGWHCCTARAPTGTQYAFRIDDRLDVPDPASRWNPDGVHGPSRVVDPLAYAWRESQWTGRPWREAVIYELHVGTFTPSGTFEAIEARLGSLQSLGVTAIELMPIAAFPGHHGWGYDGVLPFAPHAAYGSPESLKRLIDAAHARRLMVLLDVVYNHFGPEGNYLHTYAREFFTSKHSTPWGDAVNFDDEHSGVVRSFVIHNALYWLEEYRFDGLRIDAVHAIKDDSRQHIIDELIETVRLGLGRDRYVHIVLENHRNTAHFLRATDAVASAAPEVSTRAQESVGGDAATEASVRDSVSCSQWNDDFHHAMHVLLTDERDGYYVDFAAAPLELLGRALAEGFAFQGEASIYDDHRPRGESSRDLPAGAFVNFLQTHDQVGNRAMGERIAALTKPDALHAVYAILLLAPQPPLLFMGEEFGSTQPFLYFCDFSGELVAAITAGRRREFAKFAAFASEAAQARIPDPCARETFEASALRWSDRQSGGHRAHLRMTQRLLQLRAERIVPLLSLLVRGAAYHYVIDRNALIVTWPQSDRAKLQLQANLSNAHISGVGASSAATIYSTRALRPGAQLDSLAPWEVRWLHCLPPAE